MLFFLDLLTELSTDIVDLLTVPGLRVWLWLEAGSIGSPQSRELPSVNCLVHTIFDFLYQPDSSHWFQPLARTPWAFLLDSAWPGSTAGRYDIATALPRVTLVTRDGITHIQRADGSREESGADPLQLLRKELAQAGQAADSMPGIPFAGGALGYFAYDLARRFTHLPPVAKAPDLLPEMAVGIFDGAIVVDHAARTCRLLAQSTPAGEAWAKDIEALLNKTIPAPLVQEFRLTQAPQGNTTRKNYQRAFAAVQDYIRAGDCYQANLAMAFAAPCQGHPWPLYQALRQRNPAPYSAWLNFPFGQVLSSSPERFLALRDGRVETRPIKGTRARATDAGEDAARVRELAASAKDRAENLMIVDLLRNDLGKVCVPGSVAVPELFQVESFATVHHLVSTVTGHMAPDKDAIDLLAASFPGGSITGAPKQRAMEIIEELEPERRGVYCGAIGYLGFDGAMDLNIAIRTLVCAGGHVRFWAGGGLVADSEVEAEYQECMDKARALLDVLALFEPS